MYTFEISERLIVKVSDRPAAVVETGASVEGDNRRVRHTGSGARGSQT